MTLAELEKILDDRYGVSGTEVHRVGNYCIEMYRNKQIVWIKNKCVNSKSAGGLYSFDLDDLKRKLDRYFPHRISIWDQMEKDDD